MIPINSSALFDASLTVIQTAVGAQYLGRVAQIFLACKHFGRAMPQVGDPVGLSTGQLEDLLDGLYVKRSRLSDDRILILFENTFKVPSRQRGGGLATPSNIWRNNLNFQKGYMCYGSVAEFGNRGFLLQSRTLCPHLIAPNPGTLRDAQCDIRPGSRYRNEDHAKMFRKDPSTGEYFVHNPKDINFYRLLILPNNGNRIPVVPLIVALYYDSGFAAGRATVSVQDFLTDFDFTTHEAAEYFEDDPTSPAHTELLRAFPALTWVRQLGGAAAAPPAALPGVPVPRMPGNRPPRVPPTSRTSAPPAGSFWWNAEQAVRDLLVAEGWSVADVSQMGIGCDLKATKAGTLRLIEVKSSAGPCAPTLTRKEYLEACANRRDYVLAILENFDPSSANSVQWIHDPARLQLTERTVKEYYLPRSVWRPHKLDSIP